MRRFSALKNWAAWMAGAPASLDALLDDEARLEAFRNRAATGVWHACGACRIGPHYPGAVTDGAGRAYGPEGPRGRDASPFPTIPCVNLNLPVMMTAAHIADLLRGRGCLAATGAGARSGDWGLRVAAAP
jgi:choline dehydrogenase-like flavoprotein